MDTTLGQPAANWRLSFVLNRSQLPTGCLAARQAELTCSCVAINTRLKYGPYIEDQPQNFHQICASRERGRSRICFDAN
jgi:hypothetical protein